MSSGLSILSALYGAGSTTVDVKSAVSSQIRDGSISLVVSPSALNVEDPAPGKNKTLTVDYSINGGSSNTTAVKDGDYLKIDAPPVRLASGLQIVKADYGYEGNFADVTDAVKNLVSNGSISMTVSPSAVGIPDPNPAKPKLLKVDYTLNGASASQSIRDGKKFAVSAPPLNSGDVSPTIGNIIFTIVSSFIGNFIYYSLWILITFLVMDFGESKFGTVGKWGFAALSFFMPMYFGLIIMPIIIFWWALFSQNVVFS
jgi:hypothetical protein